MRFSTTLTPVPLAPEVSLYLADAKAKLFDQSGGEFHSDTPPPFYAFVWAGGQALARYVLDHREVVAGKRVHDLATGSGVAAVAAGLAGAASVSVSDSDPNSVAAALRNGAANGLELLDSREQVDVLLAGDVFYTERVAGQLLAIMREARRNSTEVLVGDPGRGYFPIKLFDKVAEYVVPVPVALEDTRTLTTAVWKMR